jgi:hypothetical protein
VLWTRNWFDPYGEERGSSTMVTDRGFLGQETDTAAGLSYLNRLFLAPRRPQHLLIRRCLNSFVGDHQGVAILSDRFYPRVSSVPEMTAA